MNNQTYQIGMIGLGVMGCNLVLNMADHGFRVAGYDKNPAQVQHLADQSQSSQVLATNHLDEFMQHLASPRLIMLLVPAGKPVEAVIEDLKPYLRQGDILIDGGNSYYRDTQKRQEDLKSLGVSLIGMGVSGGEKGARLGPCLMPGGPKEAYEQVKHIFEKVAAQINGEPCVTYIGPHGAGHFVKMVHNGIEYGMMQVISETYDILKRGLGLSEKIIQQIYTDWNSSYTRSFLIQITAQIFKKIDPDTNHYLIEQILDAAEEKGTGSWTSEESFKLREPVPTINAAVAMRDLSSYKEVRKEASQLLSGYTQQFGGNREEMIIQLQEALYAAMILTYTQGLRLLYRASKVYDYQLNLASLTQIWRGGCIIHSAMLKQITEAFQSNLSLKSLLLDPYFAQELLRCQQSLRNIVSQMTPLGIPIPGLSASLGYYDSFRSAWLPANLIQAQRDYFGSHGYKKIDQDGTFHTEWETS